MLDFMTSSLVGHDPPKIVRAAARRLNTQIPSAEKNYLERFEDLIIEHKIVERVGAANDKSTSKALLKINMDTIDEEQGDYMLNAEKKCRKIKSGRIPFSPYSSKWWSSCVCIRRPRRLGDGDHIGIDQRLQRRYGLTYTPF